MSTVTTKAKPHRVGMTKEEAHLSWRSAAGLGHKMLHSTKATPPPKPKRAGKCMSGGSATPTSLLCQLMRLKAQQKYLECNQVKLQVSNYLDEDEDEEEDDEEEQRQKHGQQTEAMMAAQCGDGGRRRRPSSVAKVTSLINDIERLKLEIDDNLQKQYSAKHGQLQVMWHYLNTLKGDVFQPERLSQFSVIEIRDRIVAISTQLERLKARNANELEMLRKEYAKLERENKYVTEEALNELAV